MMPFFKWGIGGPLGNGHQFMSFASLLDVGRGYMHILDTPDLSGPVNITTPLPVKNKDFAKAFGKALKRPAFMPIPGFALRMLYGEMADEMLLSGVRALPDKLEKSGFQFEHPTIEEALQWALKEETG
jgi:NAD dependent epimerase/dehydratase family enzyme